MQDTAAHAVRIRFAPSPTGFVHIGNLRTVLYGYLIAKKYNGTFLVRLEDTDQKRLVEGSVQQILEALEWVGIKPDEGVIGVDDQGTIIQKGECGPYVQSQRLDIYKKHADQLIAAGHAYPCFCTAKRLQELRETQQAKKQAPMYDKCCLSLSTEEIQQRIAAGEPHVIRMNVPKNEVIAFKDLVFGKIQVPSETVDDQVLIKSDGFPTYHLAVVVDDHLMTITHITRGEDWLPSTPKHVLLYRFFGWEQPEFIHFPNILNENRRKLSKRQGDVSVDDFRQKGYLPDAMVNFLVLLGWNPKTEQEIFTLEELIQRFDETAIHKAGAVFDYKKLDWMNSHYIKQYSNEQLLEQVMPYLQTTYPAAVLEDTERLLKVVSIEKERIKKLSDITENTDFYFTAPTVDPAQLSWKQMTEQQTKEKLQLALCVFEKQDADAYTVEAIQEHLLIAAQDERGQLLWPVRVALSGKDKSPSPFEIAWVIGKEETLRRITDAIKSFN